MVATPIGNARDITLRALDLLAGTDAILCEDTRRTGKLLAIYGIRRPMISYHEHNAPRVRPGLVRRLKAGASLALVSDAGTPLVSDPGYKLVRASLAAGVPVRPVPGASAPIAALSVSGLPTDRFLFAGFLPARGPARRKALGRLATLESTLVLFETARRLPATLSDMAELLGPREAAIARELTKQFEEVRRGTLEHLAAHYARAQAPKGEIVIVVAPPEEAPAASWDEARIDAALGEALAHMGTKEAAARLSTETGLSRRALYRRAITLKDALKEEGGA
ncbi:MAG: 16S rRNA (cytidine(1402)-2'-O)-methyltransferase [Alphaproteobacteria bacterium]